MRGKQAAAAARRRETEAADRAERAVRAARDASAGARDAAAALDAAKRRGDEWKLRHDQVQALLDANTTPELERLQAERGRVDEALRFIAERIGPGLELTPEEYGTLRELLGSERFGMFFDAVPGSRAGRRNARAWSGRVITEELNRR